MKKEILFEAIGEIDDELIDRSEKSPTKKRGKIIPFALAAAACLVLICVGAGRMISQGIGFDFTTGGYTQATTTGAAPEDCVETEEAVPEDTPEWAIDTGNETAVAPTDREGGEILRDWEVIYNHYDDVELLAADRLPGFTEELLSTEIAAVKPDMWYGWMDFSGFAEFSYHSGELCFVRMNVTTNTEENVVVTVSPYEGFGDCCVVVYPDAEKTDINGTEFKVFSHYWDDERLYLWATMEKNGTYFRFEHTVSAENEAQAKADFNAVLECFSNYSDGFPKLELVKADNIPEYINEELSHSEALENEAFGAYVPKEGPAGFGETYFHYSKWGNVHGLNVHWYRGLDSFDIYISEFTEADENRLVKVSDTKKYDLNLYPIPRAESVPEELWEVVNDPIFEIDDLTLEAVKLRTYYIEDAGDTDGPRMDFSVKYGDALVRVIAKGVEPEWVYECLKDLG